MWGVVWCTVFYCAVCAFVCLSLCVLQGAQLVGTQLSEEELEAELDQLLQAEAATAGATAATTNTATGVGRTDISNSLPDAPISFPNVPTQPVAAPEQVEARTGARVLA